MPFIGIAAVLTSIDSSHIEGPFSIKFCKNDGSIGYIQRAQKGKYKHKSDTSENNKLKYNIKEKFLIHVYNLDAKTKQEESRSIKIRRILEFNGHKVKF